MISGKRFGQTKVRDVRSDIGPVENALAIADAFSDVALGYTHVVGRGSLGSTWVPSHMLRPGAGEFLPFHAVDRFIDRLALMHRAGRIGPCRDQYSKSGR